MDVSSLYLGIAQPAGDGAAHSVVAQAAPDWLHLVPAGIFYGRDGRGPYHVADAATVIAASMAEGKIALDENHATDFAQTTGVASPARGWFDRLEARADGIWGHVEWNESGAALMTDKAYRGVSPVFTHGKDGTVTRILRAALTNTPNIAQLATLHTTLNAKARDGLLAEDFAVPGKRALPIPDAHHVRLAWDMVDRTEGLTAAERASARARILARAKSLGVSTEGWAASHSTQTGATMDVSMVRQALGLPDTADEAACLAAMNAQRETVARQSEQIATFGKTTVPVDQVIALQTEIATIKQGQAHDKAVAVIDAAIAAGKPIVAVREQLIAQHMSDPATVETLIAGMPSIHAARGGDGKFKAGEGDGMEAMSETDMMVAKKMGLDPKAFAAHKAKMRAEATEGAKV